MNFQFYLGLQISQNNLNTQWKAYDIMADKDNTPQNKWWKSVVIYQIYPHSFADSNQDDNGYVISDYQDIDLMFGSLQDMETLIAEAPKHHILLSYVIFMTAQ